MAYAVGDEAGDHAVVRDGERTGGRGTRWSHRSSVSFATTTADRDRDGHAPRGDLRRGVRGDVERRAFGRTGSGENATSDSDTGAPPRRKIAAATRGDRRRGEDGKEERDGGERARHRRVHRRVARRRCARGGEISNKYHDVDFDDFERASPRRRTPAGRCVIAAMLRALAGRSRRGGSRPPRRRAPARRIRSRGPSTVRASLARARRGPPREPAPDASRSIAGENTSEYLVHVPAARMAAELDAGRAACAPGSSPSPPPARRCTSPSTSTPSSVRARRASLDRAAKRSPIPRAPLRAPIIPRAPLRAPGFPSRPSSSPDILAPLRARRHPRAPLDIPSRALLPSQATAPSPARCRCDRRTPVRRAGAPRLSAVPGARGAESFGEAAAAAGAAEASSRASFRARRGVPPRWRRLARRRQRRVGGAGRWRRRRRARARWARGRVREGDADASRTRPWTGARVNGRRSTSRGEAAGEGERESLGRTRDKRRLSIIRGWGDHRRRLFARALLVPRLPPFLACFRLSRSQIS